MSENKWKQFKCLFTISTDISNISYINATFYASFINDECCLSSIDTYESKNQHKHVDEKTGRMHS